MAHNLFNSRFYNKSRVPAWHGLGLNAEEDCTAEQAYEQLGTYEVAKMPLVARTGNDGRSSGLETNYAIIVRQPTDDDPEIRVFGSPVSANYELIGPRESAAIYDRSVGNVDETIATPVETFGVLGKGEEIFITSRVHRFDIKGDAMEIYEFLYSPMYSGKSAVCGVTGIRVVCQNTLAVGLNSATSKFYITHTPGASQELETTLRDLHQRNLVTSQLMVEAYEVLAEKRVSEDQARQVIQEVYPDPTRPTPDWDWQFGISFEDHMVKYEAKMERADLVRARVTGLFLGEGTDMDALTTKGTAFGVYNAVSEFETYRRGPQERAVVSLTTGDRAGNIRKAFNSLISLS